MAMRISFARSFSSSISLVMACAAFMTKSLSASDSVLTVPPVEPVPVFVPVVSFDTMVDVVAVSVVLTLLVVSLVLLAWWVRA